MVEFYLLTIPRFPLRKKEHKSYFFGKNRIDDFRTTNRCAGYLLDHSGEDIGNPFNTMKSFCPQADSWGNEKVKRKWTKSVCFFYNFMGTKMVQIRIAKSV